MSNGRPDWADRAVAPHILSIPSYVPGKPIAELQRELGISGAVKMASNENPLGPSPMALRALESCLGAMHVYPESSGPDLRAAIAARHGVSPASVILGNGSDEIMLLAAHIFVRPGDEAVVSQNTFSMYRIAVEAFGGRIAWVPSAGRRFDLSAMAAAVNEKTRFVFLTVPNNPTGSIISEAEFGSFYKKLPSTGLILVMDEAYREYVQDSDCPEGSRYMGGTPPVLVLRTFSKIYGLAGLRVGYALGEPWLIDLLNRVRPPFNVSSAAQAAALAALDDHDHVRRSLELTAQGMAYLESELGSMGLDVVPSQANFVTFCLDRNAQPVYEALLHEGIIVRPLASFGMECCIRVTIGTMEQNQRFVGALRRCLTMRSVY
ncbi:MAG: histidinol-phosphate transaminase [Pseudomonadota bacterium]